MIFCTQFCVAKLPLLLLLPSMLLSLFYKHFYEQFIFTPFTKPAASQEKKKKYICWPGGKNIDTETETENEKIKKNQKEKP